MMKPGDPSWRGVLSSALLILAVAVCGVALWSALAAADTPDGVPPGGRRLIAAAQAGDLEQVTTLLHAGVDPDSDDGRVTALMAAATSPGHPQARLEIMRRLLAAGADVDRRADDGRTALTFATYHLGPDAVRLLLAHGADPNLLDFQGRSPLLPSIGQHGDEDWHLEMVRLLVAAGADVNVRTHPHGWTPLHAAAPWGAIEMVRLFLERGANPNAGDQSGVTPLMLCARRGFLLPNTARVVTMLAGAGADLDDRDHDRRTAADVAADSRNDALLILLSALGSKAATAHVAKRRLDGAVLLEAAVEAGRLGEVNALLAAHVEATMSEERRGALLMLAATRNHTEVVRALAASPHHNTANSPHGAVGVAGTPW